MKSFYDHLRSRLEFGEKITDIRKPVLRSSGIFPVIHNSIHKTQILFLGYWLIKRDISEISSLITLRDKSGNILKRQFLAITEPRAYSINVDSMLSDNSINSDFIGSVEVEFFSTRDMVYPFPALVLNYYNNEFNTCVHTIGRIYNDFEDMSDNEKFSVPETGFDIHSDNDLSSFVSFVNGPKINENAVIEYTVTNHKSEKFSGNIPIGKIMPYETVFIDFSKAIPKLNEILETKSGSISLKHNFSGFYPRFLVGTKQHSFPSISFTHSYYDCTTCNSPSDYWDRISDDYHDSSLYVPLFTKNDFFTELVLYPNLSPSTLDLQIDLYDKSGNLLHSDPKYLRIDSLKSKLMKINFNQMLSELNLSPNQVFSAHIITNSENRKIPTRMKFGLNVGIINRQSNMPCNICFNSKLGNPLIENKPGSFHWCPVFLSKQSVVTIGNFSPKKNYTKPAEITLTFYRKKDSDYLQKNISLPPNAEYRFEIIENDDVESFLDDHGWVTAKTSNPFVQGYYFNFHSSGSVAGDHWF
jgi:hypothetical protein